MQKESKRENVPPFLFVGSPVNDIQDCKSIPSSVFAQQDAGARRLTVASGLVEKKSYGSEEETAATPSLWMRYGCKKNADKPGLSTQV